MQDIFRSRASSILSFYGFVSDSAVSSSPLHAEPLLGSSQGVLHSGAGFAGCSPGESGEQNTMVLGLRPAAALLLAQPVCAHEPFADTHRLKSSVLLNVFKIRLIRLLTDTLNQRWERGWKPFFLKPALW